MTIVNSYITFPPNPFVFLFYWHHLLAPTKCFWSLNYSRHLSFKPGVIIYRFTRILSHGKYLDGWVNAMTDCRDQEEFRPIYLGKKLMKITFWLHPGSNLGPLLISFSAYHFTIRWRFSSYLLKIIHDKSKLLLVATLS